jgi:UDP-3-O-[3-hydroxymyristoyl] glucosamine N-acyltransferase
MAGRLWHDFPTEIDPSADIHPTAWIAPTNVRIDLNAVVMAGAIVHERCYIGPSSRINSGVVVASDAYEIVIINGRQTLRPQTGGVALGSLCEISAGSVITRSAFGGATTIGDHSVLDANVVVSHDCRVGENVRIGGNSWIGGRVIIRDHASVGPNCTIANGLMVGERAKISLGSVVTRNVGADSRVSGNFAIDHFRMIDHMRRIR